MWLTVLIILPVQEHFKQGDTEDLEYCALEQSTQIHATSGETIAESRYDFSLYDSGAATTPLYPGAQITVLQAIFQYLYWFTEHPSISKDALSDLLHFQHHNVLPPGNLLPNSYEKAMKLVEPFLIKLLFSTVVQTTVSSSGGKISVLVSVQCAMPSAMLLVPVMLQSSVLYTFQLPPVSSVCLVQQTSLSSCKIMSPRPMR